MKGRGWNFEIRQLEGRAQRRNFLLLTVPGDLDSTIRHLRHRKPAWHLPSLCKDAIVMLCWSTPKTSSRTAPVTDRNDEQLLFTVLASDSEDDKTRTQTSCPSLALRENLTSHSSNPASYLPNPDRARCLPHLCFLRKLKTKTPFPAAITIDNNNPTDSDV